MIENSRNPSFGIPIRDIIEALRAGDVERLAEFEEQVPLHDLDGDYQGVPVDPDDYDPDQIGRDLAVEILQNEETEISEERADALLDGGAFTEEELDRIKRSILDERAVNCEGIYSTLWIAGLFDDTGIVSVVWYQYEDGSREFDCFVEDSALHIADMEARGTVLV